MSAWSAEHVETSTHAQRWQDARRDLLALAAGLTVVVVCTKLVLLPFLVSGVGDFARWLARLAVISAADIVYVVLLVGGCGAVSYVAARRPLWHALWRPCLFAVFLASGAFAIFAMAFFRIMLQPFSLRVLTFVGGPSAMVSSVESYLTWPMLTALALAPGAMLLAPRLARRLVWFRNGAPLGLRTSLVGIVLVAAYATASQAYINSNWVEPRRWERRISVSPHLELLLSTGEELLKADGLFTLSFNPSDGDERDFVARERPEDYEPEFDLAAVLGDAPRPKNVIVLYLESIAAEYLSLYGSQHETTPCLDRLAAEQGVVFENFYVSAPYSCKSLVAMSASVYPRIDWNLIAHEPQGFDVPTIAQVLDGCGMRSCYAHSGYWGWRGRDAFLRPRTGELIDAEQMPEARISSWGVQDRAMFDATLDWIDSDPQTPFLLLAYTIETHHPYATPEKAVDFDVEEQDFADYLNAIRATDEHIARLVAELDKRKLRDDTLIVVTSDHGEAFGQHNQRHHNFGVYEANVHIPLVLIHPSLARLPRRVKAVREQIDLAPTIVELLGHRPPPHWQGRNLFRPDNERPAYFFCVGNNIVLGLRDGKFKYHYYISGGQEELFDMQADPGENRNLASRHARRCNDYRRRVAGMVRYQRRFLTRHGAP